VTEEADLVGGAAECDISMHLQIARRQHREERLDEERGALDVVGGRALLALKSDAQHDAGRVTVGCQGIGPENDGCREGRRVGVGPAP
jgi:hypothetical protein